MTRTRLAIFAVVVGVGMFAACSGEDGPAGPAGPPGATGTTGPTGATGPAGLSDAGVPVEAGDAAVTGCTQPCHGFGNVVDQWKFSGHFRISALASEEPIWTGTASCGNCHAQDGVERRVAGTVNIPDGGVATNVENGHLNAKTATGTASEVVYSGYGKNAIIHCTTCHAFNPTNDPHVTGKYLPGQAPLRVKSGPDDQSYIEKSPAGSTEPVGQAANKWKAGNTCVFCHKSRKDATLYITATNNINSIHWGPHVGPQADLYSGKGGYHFSGVTYGTSVHSTLASGCVSCHMVPNASNGNVPDHSMMPSLAYCKTCHTTYTGTTFDVQSGQSVVRAALKELQAALNAAGLLTRSASAPYVALSGTELTDGAFDHDEPRPGSGPSGANQVLDSAKGGALYNYLVIARGRDFGVHNPTYTKQLLWDSIKAITGANPTSMTSRPN